MKNIELIREFINAPRDHNAINHLAYYGDGLVNYSTVILVIDRVMGRAWLNIHKYSTTTSRIQNQVRAELEAAGYDIEEYDGEPCTFKWDIGRQSTVADAKRALE